MNHRRKVLITGANGQVGRELKDSAPQSVEVIAVEHSRLDITDRKSVLEFIAQIKPDIIINAAAYTAVDQAERDPEAAFIVNRDGAAHLAEGATKIGSRLIHISTDFVFDGKKSSPYLPEDTPNPISVYGASKLAGECAVNDITEGRALVLRTAWVYSKYGNNFVNTMLRLFKERDEVRVISDQVGTPTHAGGLARTLWKLSDLQEVRGIYHWTDAGVASWYDFAEAILQAARNNNVSLRTKTIIPINSSDYPLPAQRPAYSVMDKGKTVPVVGGHEHWGKRLKDACRDISPLT